MDLLKKHFLARLTIVSSVNPLSTAPLNETQLKCVSMPRQKCKVRQKFFNSNSDEPALCQELMKRHT